MEEDQVSLNVRVLQINQPLFELLEVCRDEAGQIRFAAASIGVGRRVGKRQQRRAVAQRFGQNADPGLAEVGILHATQRRLRIGVRRKKVGVGCRADREERRAVSMLKVELMRRANRPMIPRRGQVAYR